jgi:hypothetical protein
MFVFLCWVLDPIRSQATCVPSEDPCNVRPLLSCTGHSDETYLCLGVYFSSIKKSKLSGYSESCSKEYKYNIVHLKVLLVIRFFMVE